MFIALRLLAVFFVAMALMLLGADLITTLETGKITTRSIASLWMVIDKTEPGAFFVWADHHFPRFLAGSVRVLFSLWGWFVAGLGGLLLLVPGRRAGE